MPFTSISESEHTKDQNAETNHSNRNVAILERKTGDQGRQRVWTDNSRSD